MVSSVTATQQQVQTTQQTSQGAENRTQNLRDRDRDRDDTNVARARAEAMTKSNEVEQTREDRRVQASNDTPTQSAGKDGAQRRGSVLDITA